MFIKPTINHLSYRLCLGSNERETFENPFPNFTRILSSVLNMVRAAVHLGVKCALSSGLEIVLNHFQTKIIEIVDVVFKLLSLLWMPHADTCLSLAISSMHHSFFKQPWEIVLTPHNQAGFFHHFGKHYTLLLLLKTSSYTMPCLQNMNNECGFCNPFLS